IGQLTSMSSATRVRAGDRSREIVVRMAWPLKVEIISADNFNCGWTTRIHQSYDRADSVSREGEVEFSSVVSNSGDWADDYPTTTIQSGAQRYFSDDSDGRCYSRSIMAAHGVLPSVTERKACKGDCAAG